MGAGITFAIALRRVLEKDLKGFCPCMTHKTYSVFVENIFDVFLHLKNFPSF